MRDTTELQRERAQRRQMRRLKRRARLVGPFLGIPLLLGALSLSVDLIEYQPVTPTRERLSDIPIRRLPVAISTDAATSSTGPVSNVEREILMENTRDVGTAARVDVPKFDVTLPPRPPSQPYTMQNR